MTGITVYGTAKIRTLVRVRERFWKIRRDLIGQHYWHKVWRWEWIGEDRRFEFYGGSGGELRKAVAKAMNRDRIPNQPVVKVRASDFVDNPENYRESGEWAPQVGEST
jgi:hypothetical protein